MTTIAGASAMPSAEASVNPPLPSIEWIETIELGYENKAPKKKQVCFQCGKEAEKLSKCAKCQVATYCSRECQLQHWKVGVGHKHSCQTYKRVGTEMALRTEEDMVAAKAELYGRVRFYVCPYAVYKHSVLGSGFLFIQSDYTLAQVSLMLPQDAQGYAMTDRSILVHYLTVGEFDSEICRDDFELTEVRGKLKEAVNTYDPQATVVILMRFRCGHFSLGMGQLVPDYGICKALGKDYYKDSTAGALQLNLDDI